MATVSEPHPDGPIALERLRAEVSAHDRLVVAFSGGVDSALLARVAHDEVHAAGDVPGTKSPDQYTTVFVVSTRASHTAANAKKKEKHRKCGKKTGKKYPAEAVGEETPPQSVLFPLP